MNITILGSAGQIGEPLTQYLSDQGHEVNEIDLEHGTECDLRIIGDWYSDIQMSDFVYFLAYDVGGAKYLAAQQHSLGFIENNVAIMSNVFAALRDADKPFIFASSQMATDINSPYGVLKRLGEFYTLALPKGKVARLWNVFGPEYDLARSHVITDFVRSALRTGRIECLTDGSEARDFLHVNDACSGLEAIRTAPGRTYDLASGKSMTISTLAWGIAALLQNRLGREIKVQIGTKSTIQSPFVPANSSLRDETNWSPKLNFADGVNLIIDYELARI